MDIELPLFGAAEHLAAAAASSRLSCALLPHLARPLHDVLSRCSELLPAATTTATAHGDMHEAQAISTLGGMRLLDPDWVCRAHPALDLAAIAAHEITTTARPLDAALADLDDVLAGYGPRPAALEWYLAAGLLRAIAAPLSHLDPAWAARMEETLDIASRVLG